MSQPTKPKTRTTIYIEPNIAKTFKQICAREDSNVSTKIEEFMARYISVHSEGNPQLRIDRFAGSMKEGTCFFCQGRFRHLFRVKYVSGLIALTCEVCLKQNKAKGTFSTVKKVMGVIE